MARRPVVLRSLAAIFTMALCGPLAAQELALAIALRPGPPVGQTPEAAAVDVPTAGAFDQGAPIDVAFTITNHGPAPYRYLDRSYDRSGRMGEYEVEVVDGQGRRMPDPRALWGGVWMGGGPGGERELPPDATFTKHIYLNQWVMPLAPGRYSVTGAYYPEHPGAPPPAPVRSAPVALEIRSRSDADTKTYVASLGAELKSAQPERRVQALRYLGFTGSPYALPYLTSGLYDAARNAPFEAGQGFLYLPDRQACVEALLACLRERGPNASLTSLLTHYQVPPSETLAPTLKALADPDPLKRAAAAQGLGACADLGDAALQPLLGALRDPDPRVRERTAGALYRFGEPRARQPLLQATGDPVEKVRTTAIFCLGALKSQAALPRLRELLADPSPAVAEETVRALESIGPSAADALRAGLTAPSERVRLYCAATLLQFGDDSVRETLAKALETADPLLQEFLFNRLGYAVQMRHTPGPGKDGAAYCPERGPWLEWLRRGR